MPEKMLTTKQVAQLIGRKKDAIYHLGRSDQQFPKPHRIGRLLAFPVKEVERWMQLNDIEPQCKIEDLEEIQLGNPSDMLTSDEVLELLGRRSKSWLLTMVKSRLFPEPRIRRRGRQGPSLWAREDIEAFRRQEAIQTNPGKGYLSRNNVLIILNRRDWALSQWIREGRFPPPNIESRLVKTTNRWTGADTQYWKQDTIRAWLESPEGHPQGFNAATALDRLDRIQKSQKS